MANSGMDRITIRPARREEQARIRQVITKDANLDPTDLNWANFVIAEGADGRWAGLGQIRRAGKCNELGSLYVRPDLRGQGIAGAIIGALVADEPGEIYLECAGRLVPFYERFGFERVPWQSVPMPLKIKAGIGHTLGKLFGMELATMRLVDRG